MWFFSLQHQHSGYQRLIIFKTTWNKVTPSSMYQYQFWLRVPWSKLWWISTEYIWSNTCYPSLSNCNLSIIWYIYDFSYIENKPCVAWLGGVRWKWGLDHGIILKALILQHEMVIHVQVWNRETLYAFPCGGSKSFRGDIPWAR